MDLGNFAGGFSNTFFPMLQQIQQRKDQQGLEAWKKKMEEDAIQREQDRYNEEMKLNYIDVTPEILANLPEKIKPLYAPGMKPAAGGASSTIAGMNATLGKVPPVFPGMNTIQTPTDYKKMSKADYIKLLTDNSPQFTYDPTQYTGRFSKNNPWSGYLSNPNNFASQDDVAAAYKNAVAWEEDQKPKPGPKDSNIDLSRQYNGVMDAYNKYVAGVKTREDTPLKLTDWLRQPAQSGSLAIYNQFTGNRLESLEYPYGKKPATNQTGWFKTHSKPPQGISQQAWEDADWVMATSKGIGMKAVLKDAAEKVKNGKLDRKIYDALVARSKIGNTSTSSYVAMNP